MEIWKIIPGYKRYEASTHGRIRKDGIIIEPFLNTNYRKVGLNHGKKKRKIFKVSVLVAMTFLNHIPCGNKVIVDHKDEDKLNDYLNNLQLLTSRQNTHKSLKKSKTTSRFIGVYFHTSSKRWRAQIRYHGNKHKPLGSFKTEIKAHLAYRKALKSLLIV